MIAWVLRLGEKKVEMGRVYNGGKVDEECEGGSCRSQKVVNQRASRVVDPRCPIGLAAGERVVT